MSIVTLLRGTNSNSATRLPFVRITESDWHELALEAACALVRQDRFSEALVAFRRVRADYPSLRGNVDLHIAYALVQLGRHDEAAELVAEFDDDTQLDDAIKTACV